MLLRARRPRVGRRNRRAKRAPRDKRAMEPFGTDPAFARRACGYAVTCAYRGERATGIEPAFSAWEADVLPLNYAREPAENTRGALFGIRPRGPRGEGESNSYGLRHAAPGRSDRRDGSADRRLHRRRDPALRSPRRGDGSDQASVLPKRSRQRVRDVAPDAWVQRSVRAGRFTPLHVERKRPHGRAPGVGARELPRSRGVAGHHRREHRQDDSRPAGRERAGPTVRLRACLGAVALLAGRRRVLPDWLVGFPAHPPASARR